MLIKSIKNEKLSCSQNRCIRWAEGLLGHAIHEEAWGCSCMILFYFIFLVLQARGSSSKQKGI